MITNLWLLNLYLAAQIMIIIAFSGLAWLYLDLYKQKGKQLNILFIAIGGILIAFSFSLNLALRVADVDIHYIYKLIPLALGLIFTVLGNSFEKIPGKPQLKGDLRHEPPQPTTASIEGYNSMSIYNQVSPQQQPDNAIEPSSIPYKTFYPRMLLVLGLIPIPPFQAVSVTLQYLHKIKYGLSKQFNSLYYGWIAFSVFQFISMLAILGDNYLVWLDVLTRDFAVLWILAQLVLITTAIMIMRWISIFLSFRIFSKVFFSIWQWAVYLSIICAASFSLFMIQSTEDQIRDLLNKNVNLVDFTLNQIKSNNIDLLNVVSVDEDIVTAVNEKNKDQLKKEMEVFLNNNENLDQIIVVDRTGLLVYDTDRPDAQGESYTSNLLVKKAILQKDSSYGYVVEAALAGADGLEYQFAAPIVTKSDEVVGVIINVKRLDDNFLDLLKEQTNQEFIVYVGQKRSASTILEEDKLSRLENLPFYEFRKIGDAEDSNALFGKMVILTKPYYVGLLDFTDTSNNKIASMIVGTEQSILIKSTQRAIYNTFMLSLVLSALATIPSYFMAKSIKRNFTV